jgi:hypothetical protein
MYLILKAKYKIKYFQKVRFGFCAHLGNLLTKRTRKVPPIKKSEIRFWPKKVPNFFQTNDVIGGTLLCSLNTFE